MAPRPVTAVAHRGDPYHHRENTLASVRSALRKGADVVEVDVRLTLDGVPVLLHDRTLERLWRHPAPVTTLTFDELAEATDGGVPAFTEALEELRRHGGRARLLIDLTEARFAAPAVEAVREAGAAERVYYCGQLPAVRAVRELDQDAEIAMTWTTSLRPADALLAELSRAGSTSASAWPTGRPSPGPAPTVCWSPPGRRTGGTRCPA